MSPRSGQPTRERILAAAVDLLARDGLARLSMDELAEAAAVSRANLYRMFPGKSALFTSLIRVYSPLAPIGATVHQLADQPPSVVMPAIARAVAQHLHGRVGLLRTLFFEVFAPSADANAARDLAVQTALSPLVGYLHEQMAAGRLRPMHPLLAVQSFAGPIVFHLVTRPLAETQLGFDLSLEDSVLELAQNWLRAMEPCR